MNHPADPGGTSTGMNHKDDIRSQDSDHHVAVLPRKYVYIRNEDYGWIPPLLIEQDEKTAKVIVAPPYKSEWSIMSHDCKGAMTVNVKLKDYPGRVLPFQYGSSSGDGQLKDVDDLVDLPCVHEVSSWIHHIWDGKCLDGDSRLDELFGHLL